MNVNVAADRVERVMGELEVVVDVATYIDNKKVMTDSVKIPLPTLTGFQGKETSQEEAPEPDELPGNFKVGDKVRINADRPWRSDGTQFHFSDYRGRTATVAEKPRWMKNSMKVGKDDIVIQYEPYGFDAIHFECLDLIEDEDTVEEKSFRMGDIVRVMVDRPWWSCNGKKYHTMGGYLRTIAVVINADNQNCLRLIHKNGGRDGWQNMVSAECLERVSIDDILPKETTGDIFVGDLVEITVDVPRLNGESFHMTPGDEFKGQGGYVISVDGSGHAFIRYTDKGGFDGLHDEIDIDCLTKVGDGVADMSESGRRIMLRDDPEEKPRFFFVRSGQMGEVLFRVGDLYEVRFETDTGSPFYRVSRDQFEFVD